MTQKKDSTDGKKDDESKVVQLRPRGPSQRYVALQRLLEACEFDAKYSEDSFDPEEQERLRRLDDHGMRVMVAAIDVMTSPTRGGAAWLARTASSLRGVKDVRRKDGGTFNVDLADAVAIVASYAPGQKRVELGPSGEAERPVSERDRRFAIRVARNLPEDSTALFAQLFDGMSEDDAVKALTGGYAWIGRKSAGAPGLVARLVFAAHQRGVTFPGATFGPKTTLAHVQKIVAKALARSA